MVAHVGEHVGAAQGQPSEVVTFDDDGAWVVILVQRLRVAHLIVRYNTIDIQETIHGVLKRMRARRVWTHSTGERVGRHLGTEVDGVVREVGVDLDEDEVLGIFVWAIIEYDGREEADKT